MLLTIFYSDQIKCFEISYFRVLNAGNNLIAYSTCGCYIFVGGLDEEKPNPDQLLIKETARFRKDIYGAVDVNDRYPRFDPDLDEGKFEPDALFDLDREDEEWVSILIQNGPTKLTEIRRAKRGVQ